MRTQTLAIVGCGKLASIVVEALNKGLLPDYKIIGTYSRTFENAQRLANQIQNLKKDDSCKPCHSLEELLGLKPDYIVETASPDSLRELALPALKNGSSIVTLSIGALADADFYELVKKTASENGTRVHLASGAIGGFDVLRTVSLMEESTVTFKTTKGPRPLRNTSVYNEDLETEERKVFEGNAIEAIALFPRQVNVSVAAALASTGPENVKVSINSIPDYVGDDHRIEIKSKQIHAVIDVYSKTAQIAGWSVVNTLRNITSPIAF
ncbi:aspartate dehydrogenase domain-containing protein [Formosa sp. PL04]|uniref:aspartate dehydrogenase domain-containing protein n=1 Tax=Formosa sp. PL04 TaxID=3081755 RepID=UPI002981E323|nr:aspartate dehydrogenase domain-containing protein [Formosa sp. PL04]MDW5289622.1 aspartate dehydrogenase domain-containing protein [Formosa sp. PL04]